MSRNIEFVLHRYFEDRGTGEVLDAPVGVRLSDRNVLEPDLLVVLTEHAARVGTQVVDGAPDVVVEVLSPGTARRDVGPKREAYRAAGVAEYWIVDTVRAEIEVLALEREQYVRHGLFARGNILRSRVLPEFELALADVFRAR